MKVKFKKLHHNAVIPAKATQQAAAYDLVSIESAFIPVGEIVAIRTGLAIEIPEGWKGEIYARSGLASKGVLVANSPGKIDCDYRGEIKVLLYNSRALDLVGIEVGDRIAQFELSPVYDIDFEEVNELSPSLRGEKGFGSTGR